MKYFKIAWGPSDNFYGIYSLRKIISPSLIKLVGFSFSCYELSTTKKQWQYGFDFVFLDILVFLDLSLLLLYLLQILGFCRFVLVLLYARCFNTFYCL
jgi:hypothetical protein